MINSRAGFERRGLRVAAVAAVAAVALATSACGTHKAAGTETVGYAVSQPAVTITFWYMPNGPEPEKAMAVEATRFHVLHPNITVKGRMLDWATALTLLSTAGAGGAGPDVTQLGTTWVGGISALKALHEYTSAELSALGGRSAFLAPTWTATHLADSAAVTAVPWFADIRALFYRTDVLARLGLDPAKAFATWDSLETTLAAIAHEGKITPLGQPGMHDWNVVHNLAPFIWAAGGDLISADGKQSRMSTPETVAGIDYYQHLVGQFNSPDLLLKTSSDADAAFAAGQTAVFMDGSSSAADFLAKPGRPGLQAGWGTAPLPAGPKGRFTFFGGSNLAIWKSSAQPAADFEWVRFLTGAESQRRYVSSAAGVGEWPVLAAAVAGTPLATDPVYKAFADSIPLGRQYPAVASWVDIETALQKDLSTLWQTVATGKAALSQAQLAAVLKGADSDVAAAISQTP